MIKKPDLTQDQIDRFETELREIATKENVPVEQRIVWLYSKPYLSGGFSPANGYQAVTP